MASLLIRNTVGWQDTVIWNPHGDEGKGYRNFICVEAVRWGNPVQLVPGEGWHAEMSLAPRKAAESAFAVFGPDGQLLKTGTIDPRFDVGPRS